MIENVSERGGHALHMKFIYLSMTLIAYFSLHEEGGRKAGVGEGVGDCLGF